MNTDNAESKGQGAEGVPEARLGCNCPACDGLLRAMGFSSAKVRCMSCAAEYDFQPELNGHGAEGRGQGAECVIRYNTHTDYLAMLPGERLLAVHRLVRKWVLGWLVEGHPYCGHASVGLVTQGLMERMGKLATAAGWAKREEEAWHAGCDVFRSLDRVCGFGGARELALDLANELSLMLRGLGGEREDLAA